MGRPHLGVLSGASPSLYLTQISIQENATPHLMFVGNLYIYVHRAYPNSKKVFANIARTEIEAMEMKAWLETLPMHSYGLKPLAQSPKLVTVESAGAEEKSEERTNSEGPPKKDESPNNVESDDASPVANGTRELTT